MLNDIKWITVEIGKSKPIFTFENSNVFKNIDPPTFMKCEKKIINDEIGYWKNIFLLKQYFKHMMLEKKINKTVNKSVNESKIIIWNIKQKVDDKKKIFLNLSICSNCICSFID